MSHDAISACILTRGDDALGRDDDGHPGIAIRFRFCREREERTMCHEQQWHNPPPIHTHTHHTNAMLRLFPPHTLPPCRQHAHIARHRVAGRETRGESAAPVVHCKSMRIAHKREKRAGSGGRGGSTLRNSGRTPWCPQHDHNGTRRVHLWSPPLSYGNWVRSRWRSEPRD